MNILKTVNLLVVCGILTACSSGSSNNSATQTQGVIDGNVKFQVSNNVSHDFSSATVVTKSGVSLFSGAFNCHVGKTCVLAVDTNTQESYQLLFLNADGDVVAAWASESAPVPFSPVNASLENLGAYTIREATRLNAGDAHGTLIRLSNYLATKTQSGSFNIFYELGTMNNEFTRPEGSQTQEAFNEHLALSLQKTPINLKTVGQKKLMAMVLKSLSSQNAIPPINCGSGSAASVIQQLSGVVGALEDKIPVPGIGVVASGLNKILGDGCDNTFNQLNAVLSELSDISNQLNALQLGQQAIQAELDAMVDQIARNDINQTSAAINTAINAVQTNITEYNSFLSKSGASSLIDFFKSTGGIDSDTFNPTTAKYAKQLGAVRLLNELSAQKNNLYALGLTDNYQSLARNLDTVCATNKLASTQGDMIALRKMCNAKIIGLISQVSAYATAASVMMNDELATLRQYNTTQILDPIGTDASSDQQGVALLLSNAVAAIANNFSNGVYGLLEGFPSSLIANLSDPTVNCVVNANGKNTPAIVAWYPNTNGTVNPVGPNVVTHCYSGYDYKFANFYYQNVTSARNVMGVLIDAASYHGPMLTNMAWGFVIGSSLSNFANTSEMPNGYLSDTLVMPSAFKMDVYNPAQPNAYYCNGNSFCAPYNTNAGYPNGPTYALANSGPNQLSSLTKWQPNCTSNYPMAVPPECLYSSGNNNSEQAVATIAFTDSAVDAVGRKFTYLLDLYFYNGQYGSMGTMYADAYYMVCVTPDCAPSFVPGSGGLYSLQFSRGARSGGRGPNLSVQYSPTGATGTVFGQSANGSPQTANFAVQ